MIFFRFPNRFSNKFFIFLFFLGTTVNLYDGEGVGQGLLEGEGLLEGGGEGVGVFVGQGLERVFETDLPQNVLSR